MFKNLQKIADAKCLDFAGNLEKNSVPKRNDFAMPPAFLAENRIDASFSSISG
jgi:hypothetical protein